MSAAWLLIRACFFFNYNFQMDSEAHLSTAYWGGVWGGESSHEIRQPEHEFNNTLPHTAE
jgi:hypothetical protein